MGGIILTEEGGRTRKKNCLITNLSIIISTRIGLVLNPGLCGERLANKDLSLHGITYNFYSAVLNKGY